MQNTAADQVVKTLKEANNVLVTVKNSPSVDELTAAIGLTLILNRMNKHAITVFSGQVPSTLEFLQPETAIDTNTDSLRDFIIALDKSKADKLRYKVEDNVVRIFITPYKTSITEKDLDFSQGEFNVDAVVALGVVTKEDFDQAVTAHGRILHDATVLTVTKHDVVSQIGAINWQDQQASSLSEMIASISDMLGENLLDGQIATSLMTGIVAETDRFRNASTTPRVLSLSSKLMSAGANQMLIAEKLEETPRVEMQPLPNDSGELKGGGDGALEINHDDDEVQRIQIDDAGNLELPAERDLPPVTEDQGRGYLEAAEPPKLYAEDDSGTEAPQALFDEPPKPVESDSTALPTHTTLEHGQKVIKPLSAEEASSSPQPPATTPDSNSQTLSDLEKSVGSSHVAESTDPAQNIDNFLGTSRPAEDKTTETQPAASAPEQKPTGNESEKPEEDTQGLSEPPAAPQPTPQVVDATAPPAVPPPLMPQAPAQPQFFDADGKNANPFLNPNGQ